MKCTKCGYNLPDDSKFCMHCGSKIERPDLPEELPSLVKNSTNPDMPRKNTESTNEYDSIQSNLNTSAGDEHSIPQPIMTDMPVSQPDNSKPLGKKKKFIAVFAVLLLIVGATAAYFFLRPPKIIKQDIDSIDGCPEFFNLEFGMTPNAASDRIQLKHDIVTLSENTFIEIDDSEVFKLYGKPVSYVYTEFDNYGFQTLFFEFSKEDASFDELVSIYTEIYGPATSTEPYISVWEGTHTTVSVRDWGKIGDDNDDTLLVNYHMAKDEQLLNFHFDGTDLDPCSFTEKNYAFTKEPDYFTSGLVEDDDYTISQHSDYTSYTFYPVFEYMGISNGNTAIEFFVDDGETTISSASYLLLVDKDMSRSFINELNNALTTQYGNPIDRSYQAQNSDDFIEIGLSDMLDRISNGIEAYYFTQWYSPHSDLIITLSMSVDASTTYFCSVAYSR